MGDAGNPVKWENTMIGDGGWTGFDAANPDFRFHYVLRRVARGELQRRQHRRLDLDLRPDLRAAGTQFYAPVITDPCQRDDVRRDGTDRLPDEDPRARHDDARRGERSTATSGPVTSPASAVTGPRRRRTALTAAFWGDRAGGAISTIDRTIDDTSTAWAATTTGRLFVTKNVAADPASRGRLDAPRRRRCQRPEPVRLEHPRRLGGRQPGVDLVLGVRRQHAGLPGHMFRVVYDPGTGTSTWTDLSFNFGDLPVNDLVRDDTTGDLYAATDFGVLRLADGTTTWTNSAPSLPNVEVASLEIVADKRILYAATHGLSTWRLNLD